MGLPALAAAALAAAASGVGIGAWFPGAAHPWWLISLAAIPAALAIQFWSDRRTTESATGRYRRVYGPADMEHDFEALLADLGSRHKIVFILDEFDKSDRFYDMLRPLKMLLNQGGALYVVITSPEKASGVTERGGPDHTLFSEVLFVKRPMFSEMDGFIDDIVEAEGGGTPAGAWYDDLKHCLRYKSQTDFFSLYGALRDRRVGADGEGRPLVRAALDEAEATEANLQRAIESVYARKEYGAQSMQMANDAMLDAMYGAASRAGRMRGGTIAVKKGGIDFGGGAEGMGADDLGADGISAVRDLFLVLVKQGYLRKEDDEESYRVVGRLPAFQEGGIFVEEERAFVNAYDAMLKALVDFANAKGRTVDGGAAPYALDAADSRLDDMIDTAGPLAAIRVYEEARQCRESLRLPSPPVVEPDRLRLFAKISRGALDELRLQSVDLLSAALEQGGFGMDVSSTVSSDLRTLRFAEDMRIRSAERRRHGSGGRRPSAGVAVLDARDPSLLSRVLGTAEKLPKPAREIVVALTGDADPPGDHAAVVRIGPGSAARGGPTGPRARELAERSEVYVLAAQSPPSADAAETLVQAVKVIAERLESRKPGDFSAFWERLLDATLGPPSPKDRSTWTPPEAPGKDRWTL